MTRLRTLFFFLLLSFFIPALTFAGEIRILDPLGLTRAVKKVSAPQLIRIRFQQDKGLRNAVLMNRDGVVPQVVGEPSGTSVLFHNVSSGTWQVQFPKNNAKSNRITKVTIEDVAK